MRRWSQFVISRAQGRRQISKSTRSEGSITSRVFKNLAQNSRVEEEICAERRTFCKNASREGSRVRKPCVLSRLRAVDSPSHTSAAFLRLPRALCLSREEAEQSYHLASAFHVIVFCESRNRKASAQLGKQCFPFVQPSRLGFLQSATRVSNSVSRPSRQS